MDNDLQGFDGLGSNMHVDLLRLPQELDDQAIAELKPAARALIAARLERVWGVCEPVLDSGVLTGSDARLVELMLKSLERLMVVLEVVRPDRQGTEGQPEVVAAAGRRLRVLEELGVREGFLGGAGAGGSG